MSRPSRNTPELILAYQNAEYRVGGETPFTLKIGQRSEELAALMASTGVSCAALITGDNPYSTPRDPKTNREVQESLEARLSDRGAVLVDAVGVDPAGSWPGEVGYLALGLDLAWAKALSCAFGQNAFIFADADAVPTLVLMPGAQQ